MLAISTMLPHLPRAFIWRAAACALNSAPCRLTAISLRKSSSATSAPSRCRVIPALTTITSTPISASLSTSASTSRRL